MNHLLVVPFVYRQSTLRAAYKIILASVVTASTEVQLLVQLVNGFGLEFWRLSFGLSHLTSIADSAFLLYDMTWRHLMEGLDTLLPWHAMGMRENVQNLDTRLYGPWVPRCGIKTWDSRNIFNGYMPDK